MEYQNPKIVYLGTTYELPLCLPDYDWDESDFIMHTSVYTGKRTMVYKGTYCKATIRISNLAYATHAQYKAFRGKTVILYPYGSGSITQGDISYTLPSIKMICTKVKYYHMNSAIYTDACLIELVSVGYKDFSMTVVGGT